MKMICVSAESVSAGLEYPFFDRTRFVHLTNSVSSSIFGSCYGRRIFNMVFIDVAFPTAPSIMLFLCASFGINQGLMRKRVLFLGGVDC